MVLIEDDPFGMSPIRDTPKQLLFYLPQNHPVLLYVGIPPPNPGAPLPYPLYPVYPYIPLYMGYIQGIPGIWGSIGVTQGSTIWVYIGCVHRVVYRCVCMVCMHLVYHWLPTLWCPVIITIYVYHICLVALTSIDTIYTIQGHPQGGDLSTPYTTLWEDGVIPWIAYLATPLYPPIHQVHCIHGIHCILPYGTIPLYHPIYPIWGYGHIHPYTLLYPYIQGIQGVYGVVLGVQGWDDHIYHIVGYRGIQYIVYGSVHGVQWCMHAYSTIWYYGHGTIPYLLQYPVYQLYGVYGVRWPLPPYGTLGTRGTGHMGQVGMHHTIWYQCMQYLVLLLYGTIAYYRSTPYREYYQDTHYTHHMVLGAPVPYYHRYYPQYPYTMVLGHTPYRVWYSTTVYSVYWVYMVVLLHVHTHACIQGCIWGYLQIVGFGHPWNEGQNARFLQ